MPARQSSTASPERFRGFEYPDANYIYCPNQFFDVCLCTASRPVVRLVAYILRRTLGWLDKNGEPVEQNISVSYRDLIESAGVSRGSIRTALNDAVSGGFITRMQPGMSHTNGHAAKSSHYVLRWDTGNQYINAAEAFTGFFSGDGNRTPVPNAFFDIVVPSETLSVAKVVGTVIRHTVGYQNQFGGRRSSAPLSYSAIQKHTNLSDRTTISAALQKAMGAGYIQCVSEGTFHPDSDKRRAATYAVNWLSEATIIKDGSKSRPAVSEQSKKPTSNSSKSRPVNRFRNQTNRKTEKKETDKQQAVAAADLNSIGLLVDAGFDETIARQLAALRSPQEIRDQLRWIKKRNSSMNHLGLLRKAIEENWEKPTVFKEINRSKRKREAEQQSTEAAVEAKSKQARVSENRARRERWSRMSDDRKQQILTFALQNVTSNSERRTLSTVTDLADLSSGAFVIIARFLDSPAVHSFL